MKIGIISGRYPITKFNSTVNHKVYADKFGYTYIHCNWPTKAKNPYFNKINYLLSFIDFFDYLVWIDDDAFFYNFDKDIMDYKPIGDSIVSFCKSPDYKNLKTYISSGQFILKSSDLAKDFLKETLNVNLEEVKKWWKPELGYFSNGDQDAFVYLLLNTTNYKSKVAIYNYKKFNSRVDNLFGVDSHQPLILHFTGTEDVKNRDYMKVQKQYNLHRSLVPEELLVNYTIFNNVKRKKIRIESVLKRIYKWF